MKKFFLFFQIFIVSLGYCVTVLLSVPSPVSATSCNQCAPGDTFCARQCDATPVAPPSQWLSVIGSSLGHLLPTGGLPFVTGSIIPFVINLLLFIVIVASLIMLLVGGIIWITSSGDKERTAKAKATVTYALIGLTLGLGSFIILNVVSTFLGTKIF